MKKPKPHQEEAIQHGLKYFSENSRGKMIMPCGSGKTLTSLWLAKKMNANHLIIAFPSLTLEAQTVSAWIDNIKSIGNNVQTLVLGSDKKIENIYDIQTSTSVEDTVLFLKNNKQNHTVIFTTYHSSKVLVKAVEETEFIFDFCIFDEAHHTAGVDKALFQLLLLDSSIRIKKRLFMTATPKILTGKGDNQHLKSMDDESVYGKEFYRLSIREAIEKKIISDYKIITLFSSNKEIKSWIKENIDISDENGEINDEKVKAVSIAISICKSITEMNLKKIITYHNSINEAKYFQELLKIISQKMSLDLPIYHLNGSDNTAYRNDVINKFTNNSLALITNAKLLNEGFDIPTVDAVVFVNDRHSATDIVQASGRAWRLSEGKDFGYILIPCVFSETDNLDSLEYQNLRRTISVLSGQDESLAAYFRKKNRSNETYNTKEYEPIIYQNFSKIIDLNILIQDIQINVWSNIKSLYYISYNEAKEVVKQLRLPHYGIIDDITWREYITKRKFRDAPELPPNIPKRPEYPYRSEWKNYREFLGTSLYSYEEARDWNFANCPDFETNRDYMRWMKKNPNPRMKTFYSYEKEVENVSFEDFAPIIRKDYEKSKEWIKNNLLPKGINSILRYKKYLSEGGQIPKYCTRNLSKLKGFISFNDIFGKV